MALLTLALAAAPSFLPAAPVLPHQSMTEGADDGGKDRQETEDPEKRLQEIERELNTLRTTEAHRRTQRQQLAAELTELKTQLVETASRIQTLEAALFEAERRLAELTDQEHIATVKMRQERDRLYKLLSAMQSLERQRPPALIVSPDDAVKAVRSAIIMDQILPELKNRTESLVNQIKDLSLLGASIKLETESIAQSEINLIQEKTNIEYLLGKNADKQKLLQRESSIDRKRIEELARQARTLKSLITNLNSEAERKANEAREKAAEDGGGPLPAETDPPPLPVGNPKRDNLVTPSPEMNDKMARKEAPGIRPGTKFSEALGLIKLPVAGRIILNYGELNELGRKSEGITVSTRAGAQVVSPFGGKIAYAGPFLEFDQLLLIEAGEGYHIILTGMKTIFGSVGDRLRAGEPVGIMGSDSEKARRIRFGKQEDWAPGETEQSLYIEFRKDGDPIDPKRWLADDIGKARG